MGLSWASLQAILLTKSPSHDIKAENRRQLCVGVGAARPCGVFPATFGLEWSAGLGYFSIATLALAAEDQLMQATCGVHAGRGSVRRLACLGGILLGSLKSIGGSDPDSKWVANERVNWHSHQISF